MMLRPPEDTLRPSKSVGGKGLWSGFRSAQLARRSAEAALEGAGECRLRLIARCFRNLDKRILGREHALLCVPHPPLRQIVDRAHTDELRKTLGESRP